MGRRLEMRRQRQQLEPSRCRRTHGQFFTLGIGLMRPAAAVALPALRGSGNVPRHHHQPHRNAVTMKLHSMARRRGPILAWIVASASLLGGCASTTMREPITGYTCCNLQGTRGYVMSSNVQGQAMLPFGMPVHIYSMKRTHYAYGTIDGEEWGFTYESGSKAEDTVRWLRRIVVKDDPKARFETWPADVRNAVSAGRVIAGMTREQVAMAIGYPSENDTPNHDAPVWRYFTEVDAKPVDIQFGADGRVDNLTGGASAVRLVMLHQ